ncbi:MAG: hypothetical protein NTY55_02405 [Flavobacteriia bacterium]|nr:hypothetical protein [Flavobacteriia bacterium]
MSDNVSLENIHPSQQEMYFKWFNDIVAWLFSINLILELGEYRFDFQSISCDSSGKYWIDCKTSNPAVKYSVQLCIDTGDGMALRNGSQGGIATFDTNSRWILLDKVIVEDEDCVSFVPEVFILTL